MKINLENSSILSVRTVENLEDMAAELGCKKGKLPTTYLGLPLRMKRKSTQVWDGVEERFRKKLTLWKRQHISKGGRMTLIKRTLSNLPIYIMSLYKLSKGVKIRLDKIQRDFLRVGGNLDRNIHLVNWGTVYKSKESGGLGVRRLEILNKSLLGK